MKKYKRSYKGVQIPQPNGRPQLWMRGVHRYNQNSYETLRIIFPDGNVHYSFVRIYSSDQEWINFSCTSGSSQIEAIKRSIDYERCYYKAKPIFVCYL